MAAPPSTKSASDDDRPLMYASEAVLQCSVYYKFDYKEAMARLYSLGSTQTAPPACDDADAAPIAAFGPSISTNQKRLIDIEAEAKAEQKRVAVKAMAEQKKVAVKAKAEQRKIASEAKADQKRVASEAALGKKRVVDKAKKIASEQKRIIAEKKKKLAAVAKNARDSTAAIKQKNKELAQEKLTIMRGRVTLSEANAHATEDIIII